MNIDQIRNSKILLVDDTPQNLEVLFQYLTAQGFTVLIAQDGESAISLVKENTPDLILLDILMPGIDGFETCRRLKADINYTEIPVSIMASPSITPGVYPLSVNIEFYDRTGTIQTVTSIVGLQIGGTTDFEIVLQQSMGGSTTFAVANTGAEVASSVIVSIPPQINYATTGASSVSLGNLDCSR